MGHECENGRGCQDHAGRQECPPYQWPEMWWAWGQAPMVVYLPVQMTGPVAAAVTVISQP